jgi:hypothetical protein
VDIAHRRACGAKKGIYRIAMGRREIRPDLRASTLIVVHESNRCDIAVLFEGSPRVKFNRRESRPFVDRIDAGGMNIDQERAGRGRWVHSLAMA